MKRLLIALTMAGALGVGLGAPISVAQEDPIKVREQLMEDIGRQSKVVGDMLQGKTAYDAAAAKAALTKIAADATDFPNHFPEGSDQGNTEALPAIWQNKADFEAKSKKLADDATAAAAATDTGEDAFKQATGAMFGNCKACHELYRKPS